MLGNTKKLKLMIVFHYVFIKKLDTFESEIVCIFDIPIQQLDHANDVNEKLFWVERYEKRQESDAIKSISVMKLSIHSFYLAALIKETHAKFIIRS